MIILGIDTATESAQVALVEDGKQRAGAHTDGTKTHSETLLETILLVLEKARVSMGEIGLIAVGIGPGAWTSLRVGVTTAKTLSYALNIPIIGMSTLDVVAAGVADYKGMVIPVIDARKGEVYSAPFISDGLGGIKRVGDYRSMATDEFFKSHRGNYLVVGNGVSVLGEGFPRGVELAPESLWQPDASVLCRLALERFKGGGDDDPKDIVPLYVRRSDAEINLEKREAGL